MLNVLLFIIFKIFYAVDVVIVVRSLFIVNIKT